MLSLCVFWSYEQDCSEICSRYSSSKYAALESLYLPAVESLGPINNLAKTFLVVLGRRNGEISGDCRDGSFLLQGLSVLIQNYNAVLLHDSFVDEEAGTGIPA